MDKPSPPKTIAEALRLLDTLRARKAVLQMLCTHLKEFYTPSDANKSPECRISKEDTSIVSVTQINDEMLRMEQDVEEIDVLIEELTNHPVGGGGSPAAEGMEQKEAAPVATAEETPTDDKNKKGTPGGKARTTGGRPS